MKRTVGLALLGFGVGVVGTSPAVCDSPLASGGQVYPVVSGDRLDIVHVFSYDSGVQTFANTSGRPLAVRYLAVGAGGCGGSVKMATERMAGGGGGGGGGVAEDQAELAAGEIWSIFVGKGSVSSSTGTKPYYAYGSAAGATAVSNAMGEVICVPGGGLGGNSNGPTAGAAGGGIYGYINAKPATNGTFASSTCALEAQGPYGGGANASALFNGTRQYWLAGGGGGAGGAGETPEKDGARSGNGGAGIPCDITGSVVYYGAGGGGGGCICTNQVGCANVSVKIAGGVGGTGAGNGGTYEGETPVVATSGRDGLGAGGGGGLKNSSNVSALGGSGGHGTVVVRYTCADLNPLSETPAFASIGAVGEVTVRVAGEVETDGDGKMWLKPGSTAALWATDAGGTVLAGWEDDATGEFIRGEVAFVTPATRRSYTAVFGKPWTYSSSTLSNGDWEFAVSSGKIYACSRAPADSVLNLATPMYKKDGSVYRLTGIGRGSTNRAQVVVSHALCTTVRLFLPEGAQINTSAFNADYSAGVRGNLSIPRDVVVKGSAFQECRALTNLFFEGGVDGGQTLTEYGTFDNCRNLKRVGTLPRSAGSLARHAFYRCGFKSIELPGVTNLSVEAFYRVPLTNVVFGTNVVTFNAYKGVYGNTLFSGAAAGCAFRFPGKAPVLVCTGTNTAEGLSRPFTGGIRNSDGETVNSAMFGENSGVRFYGSWRTDPEGWRRVRETIGALVPNGLALPALDPSAGDRGVKGVFYWSHGASAPYQGWLIDAAMPNEPPPRGTSFLFR